MLQDEVENPCRVEMSRVKCRTSTLSQNEFLGRDEVVDSSGHATRHHGYPDIEHDIQSPGSELRDDLESISQPKFYLF